MIILFGLTVAMRYKSDSYQPSCLWKDLDKEIVYHGFATICFGKRSEEMFTP